MADTDLRVRFKHPYKTEAEWEAITTIPKTGEALYTKTGPREGWYKIGDGVHQWKDLLYIKPTYNYSEIEPLKTVTYNNVTCSANNDPNAYLYFATVKPDNFEKPWRISYKEKVTINGISNGFQYCEVTIDGVRNTYSSYSIYNVIANTSYRPLYTHILHSASETGINNNYEHLIGIRFHSSYQPHIANNSRIVEIEIIEEENCTLTFLDSMKKFSEMSGANTTNYGNSSSGVNATRYSFNGTDQGYTVQGDRNDTTTLLYSTARLTAGSNGIPAYNIIMMKPDGTWEGLTTGNATTATTSPKNTSGFVLGEMYLYWSSTNVTSGNMTSTNTIRTSNDWIDLRYTFDAGTTLTNYEMVYIKGTVVNGLFYLADTWWTQSLPTEKDDFVYIPIGMCINNDSEITVMANTTIKYDNNISHYLNNENIQFKIRSYDSTINFNNYNEINWVNSSSNDFNYLIEYYDIIKNSIKLTNVCKFDNVNNYIGIDIKNKKYPYYNFKKNKITRLKLQDNIYIRPILHLNKK